MQKKNRMTESTMKHKDLHSEVLKRNIQILYPGSPNTIKKKGFHQVDYFLSREFSSSKIRDHYFNSRLDFQGVYIRPNIQRKRQATFAAKIMASQPTPGPRTPPPEIAGLIFRAYENPLSSLNKAGNKKPLFLRGGYVENPLLSWRSGRFLFFPFEDSHPTPRIFNVEILRYVCIGDPLSGLLRALIEGSEFFLCSKISSPVLP